MFWINADKAIPAFSDQLVKLKVADYAGDYVTYGYYNHRYQEWWTASGYNLKYNVYAWKHVKKSKKHIKE